MRRLAILTIYGMVYANHLERAAQKPFNPLLGETFEFVDPHGKFKMISELCIHHPPVIAYHVEGTSGYKRYSTMRIKPKFTKGSVAAANQCRDYIEFAPYDEVYSIKTPGVTINNIIIGTPYLDLCGRMDVKCIKNNPKGMYSWVDFFKRGWSEKNYFRMQGEIYAAPGDLAYRVEGRWSENVTLVNAKTGEREVIWEKKPYPENWQYMYGMTHYLMQLNYLPNTLRPFLPPTDSRLRPD